MKATGVVLIVAISARALAQAARRAGLAPVAIDAFGDQDTREACLDVAVARGAEKGFADSDLDVLLPPFVIAHKPIGVIYGSGFDDRPDQLRRIADHAQLLGAAPITVAASKDPLNFAALCAKADLRHPEISTERPSLTDTWLLKRAGGCGGAHIREGAHRQRPTRMDYWQRRIVGRSVSLLFTRDDQALTPLAWSEQWTSPGEGTPYRYGGASGPIEVKPADAVIDALVKLAASLNLHGLASADFIDDGKNLWILEINPRPGATLDVFDHDADPLILRHLRSLAGYAAAPWVPRSPKASTIVYAEREMKVPDLNWPYWAADRSPPGAFVPKGAPLCTVLASGETVPLAKSLLSDRVHELVEIFEGSGS